MRYGCVSVGLFLVVAACAQEPVPDSGVAQPLVERAKIEAAYETVRGMIDSGDYAGFADLFAEDGTFVNSTLPEPVRGREAIRTAVSGIPPLVNREEWVVIDGNRLVFG